MLGEHLIQAGGIQNPLGPQRQQGAVSGVQPGARLSAQGAKALVQLSRQQIGLAFVPAFLSAFLSTA